MNNPPQKYAPDKPRFFYGWYMAAASWVMLFLLSAVGVGIFFKPILEEFGWDRATLSAVHTFALLLFAVAAPFIGRLIDRFGPKIMLFVCLATQIASSTVNGLATSIWHIFTGRFLYEIKALQGSQVLINRWFVKKRGRAQGIAATGMPIGALLLSPLSQYLVLAWGWRNTMFFWAGVTFVILLPLTLLIRNSPEEKGYGPDGGPVRSLKTEADNLQAGVPAFSGHTLAQAARLGSFWLISAAQLICGIGCGFMMTHIVIFATDFGYSDMIGASLLSVQGGLNLVGVLLTGHISDRYARNKVLAFTHGIRSLSFFAAVVFILLGGGSLWMLYLAMALFGFGWFTTSPLTSGLVADLFGGLRMGTIIGVTMSCHTVGMALGAYAGGITFEVTGSYYSFFLVQAVLELLAAGLAFAIKRKKKY
ncbi:MAG TPA: MFS transporter [Dehalococcoidales bacterium]|nr:MFS transporter [Dehalococcoidales bacterium]